MGTDVGMAVCEGLARASSGASGLGLGVVLGLGLVAPACAFDPSALGSSGGIPVGSAGTSSSGEPEGSSGTGHADGGSTAGTDGEDAASASSGPADGDDATTGAPVDPCESPPPVTFEFDATQAMLSGPMLLDTSVTEGPYAYSEVAGQGQASFQFLVPCQAEFRVFGRVFDPGVGASAIDFSDPDSYFVAFDGEGDSEWWYGCQTFDDGLLGGVWAWVPVLDNPLCSGGELRRTLSPGTHLLHLTNREAGNHASANVAAVARVVVTSDPAFVPP
jgi:hypothetical protein